MKFGLFTDLDRTRYAGLRLRRLKQAIEDETIIAAVARSLEVAGEGRKQRMAAVERRIDELRGTAGSPWHGVAAPEVLAASIFNSRELAGGAVEKLYNQAAAVDDLKEPLATWLKLSGLEVYTAAGSGSGRLGLAGHRDTKFVSAPRLVAVEAVNEPSEVDAAIERLGALRDRANALYLAGTPALIAGYLGSKAAASRAPWDGEALRAKLQASGIGLLVIEGDAVSQAVLPVEHKPSKTRLEEFAARLGARAESRK